MTMGERRVALLLVAGFLFAFGLGGGRLPEERALLLAAGHAGAAHTGMLVALTRLGNLVILGPISFCLAALFVWRRSLAQAAVYLIGTLVGRLGEDALKAMIARPRPALLPHLDQTWASSFPSAHAFNATLVFVAFTLIWGDRRLLAAAIVLVAAIGTSRVMLAVHWPSDVVGGWCLGGLAALLVAALARAVTRERRAPRRA